MASVVGHLQGEVVYPVVEHAVAERHETQHLIGQMYGLARGFQQDADAADGRVGIVGYIPF